VKEKQDFSKQDSAQQDRAQQSHKLFVPFSEDLLAAAGSPLGELVPFQLEYQCVRLLDGTYEFNQISLGTPQTALQSAPSMVHAA
jgi:hypothetical protein